MDPLSYLHTSAASRPGRDPTPAAEPALACTQLHTQVHTPASKHRLLKPCAEKSFSGCFAGSLTDI